MAETSQGAGVGGLSDAILMYVSLLPERVGCQSRQAGSARTGGRGGSLENWPSWPPYPTKNAPASSLAGASVWSGRDLNSRPLQCDCSALPAELPPHRSAILK